MAWLFAAKRRRIRLLQPKMIAGSVSCCCGIGGFSRRWSASIWMFVLNTLLPLVGPPCPSRLLPKFSAQKEHESWSFQSISGVARSSEGLVNVAWVVLHCNRRIGAIGNGDSWYHMCAFRFHFWGRKVNWNQASHVPASSVIKRLALLVLNNYMGQFPFNIIKTTYDRIHSERIRQDKKRAARCIDR